MSARLDCPEIERLQALLAAALPPDQQERCERHLESCPVCQKYLDRATQRSDLVRLARQMGDPTLVPPDPTLVEVVERLHGSKNSTHADVEDALDLYFLKP